jgi:epoxide hydrolase 4
MKSSNGKLHHEMKDKAVEQPTSIFIPTNGIHLHAISSGPHDGPSVILLHGFPEFWYGWRHQIASLSQAGYRVIVPDQRGYNLSQKPASVDAYTIEQLANDVLGIIRFMGREKAIIAGHDWGAAVAWYLAMYHPQSIEKLIIANVPHQAAFNRALQKPVFRQLKKSLYFFFFQIPRLPEWGMLRKNCVQLRETLLKTSNPGTFQPGDLEEYVKAWSQTGALTGGINWYRAMMRMSLKLGQKRSNRIFQHRITMPTLLLWGDQDAFIEPFLADWSMQWVDHGQLIRFADAGHWVLHEKQVEVNQSILHFLENGVDVPLQE